MADMEVHTGVFFRVCWRAKDSDYVIASLEDGMTVKGQAPEGELTPGLTYDFYGRAGTDEKYGDFFSFKQFKQREPHSQAGIVAYLQKYAFGVGPRVAVDLWDRFGGEAVKVLRTQPELAASVSKFLTVERAKIAASQLQQIAALEDTKIELNTLFAGRGFSTKLADECVKKWGILAPARIKRDPLTLIVENMPSCGWARCDKLYLDLGLRPEKLKRQMIAMWFFLREDTSGHTWHNAASIGVKLRNCVSAAKINAEKAFKLGERAKWLAGYRDEEGKLWVADADKAEHERCVAERLVKLMMEDVGDGEPKQGGEIASKANPDEVEENNVAIGSGQAVNDIPF